MSISIRSFSGFLHSSQLAVKEIALKEWAVCIEALRQGDQFLLIRKGGVVEETRDFRLEDTTFYLYPTYEHQKKDLVKKTYQSQVEALSQTFLANPNSVMISYLAHVVDDIRITELEDLKKLSDYHILTDEYAAERLHWKSANPLHILIVRIYALDEARTLPIKESYLGCKSWIRLDESFDGNGSKPILSDEEFSRVRLEILQKLGIHADH